MPTETIEAPAEPGTLDLPGLDSLEDIRQFADITGPWIVIVYNCDCHTFEDVWSILQKATGCSLEKAKLLSYEIDSRGRAIVFSGERDKCEQVASIIGSIRLQVETDRA